MALEYLHTAFTKRCTRRAVFGCTMSLFIVGLAFSDAAHLDAAKLGILTTSLIAGITGWGLLRGTREDGAAPRAGQ